MLESLIGEKFSHIKAERVLNFDSQAINNLLEIIELWSESADRTAELNDTRQRLGQENTNLLNNYPGISTSSLAGSSTKSAELADMLDRALKNHLLAKEIERKVKKYLGDVTVKQSNDIRSSRQSVVRTRAIPTFNFNSNKDAQQKNSKIFSSDLARLFPEIDATLIESIQEMEKNLIMSEKNIRVWQEHLAGKRTNRVLSDVVDQQRARIDVLEKNGKEGDSVSRAKKARAQMLAMQGIQREERAQKAALQREIDQFYRQSTAAYLSARANLEKILVVEFKKVDANQRQHIKEMRKYLQYHYETETDKLRKLLSEFEEM